MKRSLLIVYSNLGLGGIPIQIMDIAHAMIHKAPTFPIYVLIKERREYDIRSHIHNPSVTYINFYDSFHFDSALLFILWSWYWIYKLNPSSILSFLSPFGLTVLSTKILFFWRKTTIVINEAHFTSTMLSTMMMPILQQWGMRVLYPLARIIIVPTQAIYEDLHKQYSISYKKMIVIQNWSRYAAFNITRSNRPFDVIYAGRIDAEKNVISLIKVCESLIKTALPNLRFLIVGDGHDKNECIAYIHTQRLQSNIFIRPPVLHISALLKQSKICIFAPQISTEGFPVVLLDAISLGTLVITTGFYGLKEVLNKSNSIIVGSYDAMAKSILFALTNRRLLPKKISSAKEIARSHHSTKNIGKYLEFLNI